MRKYYSNNNNIQAQERSEKQEAYWVKGKTVNSRLKDPSPTVGCNLSSDD